MPNGAGQFPRPADPDRGRPGEELRVCRTQQNNAGEDYEEEEVDETEEVGLAISATVAVLGYRTRSSPLAFLRCAFC